MAFGNAVFGGLIGAGIDMANGAAYEYPEEITVYMGTAPFKPEPGAIQGTPTAPSSTTVPASTSPSQNESTSNSYEVYRRNTSPGVPVTIASHGEWDHLCRAGMLPTVTITDPPSHGRIEIAESDFVIGHSRSPTSCVGQVAHGDTVVYVPEKDFHGIDQVSYRVTYHRLTPVVRHAEIAVQ